MLEDTLTWTPRRRTLNYWNSRYRAPQVLKQILQLRTSRGRLQLREKQSGQDITRKVAFALDHLVLK